MPPRRLLAWLTVWSAAFGVVEGAVVVYLRRIFYPGMPADGPLFPLPWVDAQIMRTELAREAATMLMLVAIAGVSERRPLRRFAALCFCFGAWDIAYYAMLHFALGWPQGLMTWDVLFLIPSAWSGPVLAPVLVSLALMAGAVLILRRDEARPSPFRAPDWLALVAAGAVIVWSFLWNTAAVERLEPPGDFPWWLFLAGLLAGLAVLARALRRAD